MRVIISNYKKLVLGFGAQSSAFFFRVFFPPCFCDASVSIILHVFAMLVQVECVSSSYLFLYSQGAEI